MNLTSAIPRLTATREQVGQLLQGGSSVACFGSPALLTLFIAAAPDPLALVGAATTEEEGLALIARQRPAFLFATDLLEAGDGIALVRRAHDCWPELHSLLILQRESPHRLRQAMEAGCHGVVLESRLADGVMVQAIRAVVGGGIYADRLAVAALRHTGRGHGSQPVRALTPRETEVLQGIVRGLSNPELARQLWVSTDTIKTYVTSILAKLGVRDRTQAAVVGLRLGLVEWD